MIAAAFVSSALTAELGVDLERPEARLDRFAIVGARQVAH